MKKPSILGTITLFVIIGAVVFYTIHPPKIAQAPTQTATSSAAVALPPGAYTEHAPYYDISAIYATTTPLSGVANTNAVNTMRTFVASTIAQFKTDGNFANLTPQDAQTIGLSSAHKESLKIAYLISSSTHSVSYIFTVYEDTLGAHGNMFFKTFTFDTTTGQERSISDLFTPNSDYLGALSKIARADLPTIIGDQSLATQMLDQGTTPDEKNFANFFLDNNMLVILFAPYQVAPYAAGPQTLRIPLSNLTNILKPEYQ